MGVISDPVADMLTRIRNAQLAGMENAVIPGSNLKRRIAEIFTEEGFVTGHRFHDDGKQGLIEITLKYLSEKDTAITGLRKVSKPSRRVYVSSSEIPQVRKGQGIAVLSTSCGVMTDAQARREGVGGEILCEIW